MDIMSRPALVRPITIRKHVIRELCDQCENNATTEAFFDLEDLIIVRRYCDDCLATADYDGPPGRVLGKSKRHMRVSAR